MRLRDRKIRTAQAGFSMIEVLIVVAIIMIISAMAAPNVITSLRQVKLRGASSSMINIFEQARMLAVRDNKGYMVRSAVAQGATFWYIDLDGDAAMGVNEPQVALPQSVGIAVAPPSNASLNLTSPNSYMLPAQTGPAFNPRGLPCYATGTSCVNFDNGNNRYANFVYYIQDNGYGGILYMAVTIGPNGKMKVWNWNGAAWK